MKVGFLGLLALLFIGLKLGGAITWSWWFVLAPLYFGPLSLGVLFVMAYIVATVLRLGGHRMTVTKRH